MQSQYLSGITEKSDEESGGTNRPLQSSYYQRDKENHNGFAFKNDAFLSSNSSARSSRINSRLLRYFEDSLQKEIPVSLSPSIKPNDKSKNANTTSNNPSYSKSNPNFFKNREDIDNTNENHSASTPKRKQEKEGKKLRKSQDNLSSYSLTRSNNYEDYHSNNTSSKKKQYKYFFNHKNGAESDDSNNYAPKVTFDQLDSKEDSCNSSMTRKERNIDNFIESARDDNILSNLGENDQNLNISSISRLEESTPSKKQAISEDEKTDRELENSDRKISRQPTFSSFTPQPKDEKEYCQRKVAQLYEDKENGSEGRAGRNHSYQEGMLKPLLLSLSGTNYNPEEVSHNGFNGNNFRPESCIKSSEGTYPQFFISSDTKNLNVSSEGSRKYRSPTFEAISEEENNRSHCMIDSPTHKRLCMDVDYPEKFVVNRASRRPPSIHAALSPDISLTEREIINQNPKILIAHYENVISSLRKDYEEMYNRNGGLERQVDRLKTQLSDSNKLLLKLQEGMDLVKVVFWVCL